MNRCRRFSQPEFRIAVKLMQQRTAFVARRGSVPNGPKRRSRKATPPTFTTGFPPRTTKWRWACRPRGRRCRQSPSFPNFGRRGCGGICHGWLSPCPGAKIARGSRGAPFPGDFARNSRCLSCRGGCCQPETASLDVAARIRRFFRVIFCGPCQRLKFY